MTTKEEILALAGEPVGMSDEILDDYVLSQMCKSLPNQPLYTESQLLAARKPLEDEIERLKKQSANRLIGVCKAGENNDELRQQLAEKDAEIASLKAYNATRTDELLAGTMALAAAQAREQQRAANTCSHHWHDYGSLGGENVSRCSRCNALAFTGREPEALALPADTAALEAMIQRAGEVMRERCAAVPWAYYEKYRQEAIRALPGVTLEDLK